MIVIMNYLNVEKSVMNKSMHVLLIICLIDVQTIRVYLN